MRKTELQESIKRPYFRKLRFFSLLSLFGKNMDDWPTDNGPPVIEMLGKSIFFNFIKIPLLLLIYPTSGDLSFIFTILKLLIFVLPLFLLYMFLLPFIMLELSVYSAITIVYYYVTKIFSDNSYDEDSSYVELKTCMLHILYFFISVFSYIDLYKYIGSTSVNMIYISVLIFFLYPYISAFFLFFRTYSGTSLINLPFERRYEIIGNKHLIGCLDKIYNADNYYNSSFSDKRLIEAYRLAIDTIENQRFADIIKKSLRPKEINNNFGNVDALFCLLDRTADYNRIEDIDSFKTRLLGYVDDNEKFLLDMDSLLIKSRIMYNINNEVIVDKIIKEIGVKKTREYIDDLSNFINKHMNRQYADVYNRLFFITETKLL